MNSIVHVFVAQFNTSLSELIHVVTLSGYRHQRGYVAGVVLDTHYTFGTQLFSM